MPAVGAQLGNTTQPATGNITIAGNFDGPHAFTAKPRAIQWPIDFKITVVKAYDGQVNPEQWLTCYAIAMRVSGGDTNMMANYLPIMLKPSVMNWLTSLRPDTIESWDDLKRMFVKNYKPTCE